MASVGDDTFLLQAATYLGATAIAVPVFKRLKLGTILGFLAAGVALGPSGLGVLDAAEGVFHVAEFGVVLFLFVIGLELSFGRLWSLRRTIFGLGLAQMAVTGLAIGAILQALDVLPPGAAYVAGFALACSSTAFVLSFLEERGELNSPHGTKAFSVLLFQDLAVIPLLAAIPIVAQLQRAGADEALSMEWEPIALAIGAIVAVVVLGKFALNPFFRLVARSGSREAFTAAALFVVAGVALLVAQAGLSMALGAFLAGVMLAESSYRHQIEADIEPFRELLLGLFFIGVGMQLDLSVISEAWAVVLAATAALMALKAAILYGLARAFASEPGEAPRIAAVLCQGGEFGFVVFSLGVGQGLFTGSFATMASAAVTLSMMLTPLVVTAASRSAARTESAAGLDVPDGERGDVLLVGFGRFGQIVAQVLIGSGATITTIDNDPKRIETAGEFGYRVFYGDGTDAHLLEAAGATRADVVVFALNDVESAMTAIGALRERCPKVRIVTRAYDRMTAIRLMDSGADAIIRDTLESALMTAERALTYLGRSERLVADLVAEFRERDEDRMMAQKAGDIYSGSERVMRPFEAIERRDAAREATEDA